MPAAKITARIKFVGWGEPKAQHRMPVGIGKKQDLTLIELTLIELRSTTLTKDDIACSYAVSALQFFASQIERQLEMWGKCRPASHPFFPNGDGASNYFYGIGCVYITYAGSLYNRFHSEGQLKVFADFSDELNALMFKDGSSWSEMAVKDSKQWKLLRGYAARALTEIGESILDDLPIFDVKALVSITEFRPGDEVGRLLD